MRRTLTAFWAYIFRGVAVVLLAAVLTPWAHASSLPAELGNWHLSSQHVTELTTSGPDASDSREHGRWTSASYVRSAFLPRIDVQLMEGPGTGQLYVPEGRIFSDGGPIGFLSTYETLTIAGRRAILERSDVTGQTLAVAMGTRRTITFETRGISREELLEFAENMVEALRD